MDRDEIEAALEELGLELERFESRALGSTSSVVPSWCWTSDSGRRPRTSTATSTRRMK